MNVEYFIAKKVAASGSQSFSRLIIRIAILAIALSLSVMIISTALITGFKKEISEKIFGFFGHIHIMDTNVNRAYEAIPINKDQNFYHYLDTIGSITYLAPKTVLGFEIGEELVEKQTKGGVQHIQSTLMLPAVIQTKKAIEGVMLKGIGEDFDWRYVDQYIVEGERLNLSDTLTTREIIVSRETANRIDLEVSQRINMVFIIGGQQVRRRYVVKGIYKTGLEEYDRQFAIVDMKHLQKVLGWDKNQVGGFEVFIDNLDDLDPLTEYIYLDRLPNTLYCESIKDKEAGIFQWLSLQDTNEIVILLLILVVAVINMVTALMILILERTNMIGMLKALGLENWKIQKVFLYHAAYIILIGLMMGNILGLALCWVQKKFELIKLSEADYYLAVAPIELNIWIVLLLNVGTILVTLTFLIIPSFLVARITPVKAIRFK